MHRVLSLVGRGTSLEGHVNAPRSRGSIKLGLAFSVLVFCSDVPQIRETVLLTFVWHKRRQRKGKLLGHQRQLAARRRHSLGRKINEARGNVKSIISDQDIRSSVAGRTDFPLVFSRESVAEERPRG